MTKIFNKLKSNKLLMKLSSVLIICVVLCSMLVVPSSAADLTGPDLVNTSWYFNETLTDFPDTFTPAGSTSSNIFTRVDVPFSFADRSENVIRFSRSISDSSPALIYYGLGSRTVYYYTATVAHDPGWADESYRTITFSGTVNNYQNVPADFITWLTTNAVQIVSFSVNGSFFKAPIDSSWSSFVDSDLNSGSFTISGDNVFYDGYRLDGVKASDLIQADRNYSFPPSASYFMTAEGILDWVMAAITDSLKIFYVEGQGLTLVGVLGVVSVSISIAFLLISVISNFLKNRG